MRLLPGSDKTHMVLMERGQTTAPVHGLSLKSIEPRVASSISQLQLRDRTWCGILSKPTYSITITKAKVVVLVKKKQPTESRGAAYAAHADLLDMTQLRALRQGVSLRITCGRHWHGRPGEPPLLF